jgi:hypothetical protein
MKIVITDRSGFTVSSFDVHVSHLQKDRTFLLLGYNKKIMGFVLPNGSFMVVNLGSMSAIPKLRLGIKSVSEIIGVGGNIVALRYGSIVWNYRLDGQSTKPWFKGTNVAESEDGVLIATNNDELFHFDWASDSVDTVDQVHLNQSVSAYSAGYNGQGDSEQVRQLVHLLDNASANPHSGIPDGTAISFAKRYGCYELASAMLETAGDLRNAASMRLLASLRAKDQVSRERLQSEALGLWLRDRDENGSKMSRDDLNSYALKWPDVSPVRQQWTSSVPCYDSNHSTPEQPAGVDEAHHCCMCQLELPFRCPGCGKLFRNATLQWLVNSGRTRCPTGVGNQLECLSDFSEIYDYRNRVLGLEDRSL